MSMKKLILSLLFACSLWSIDPACEVSAYWDGNSFHRADFSSVLPRKHMIEGPTIYFAAGHITCYGHALLDGVIPLYSILKKHDLLKTPINLIIPVDSYIEQNQTFRNILQLLEDIFKIKQIILLNKDIKITWIYVDKLIVDEHVPFSETNPNCFAFYRAYPESFEYIYTLKKLGFRDNVIFQDTHTNDNLVKEFVSFVTAAYNIHLPMIKNRVLIVHRAHSKKILNSDDLINTLKNNGYNPVSLDFEKMSVREQIIETIQSEYFIGTYGSNLVNAMFLKPEANVVILWHKYAKYFWSRRYCVIHSAFLSVGVKLIECDHEYDARHNYPEKVQASEYFYRKNHMNILRPEKIDMETIINYPLAAMSEITTVDLYVEPQRVLNLMQEARNN